MTHLKQENECLKRELIDLRRSCSPIIERQSIFKSSNEFSSVSYQKPSHDSKQSYTYFSGTSPVQRYQSAHIEGFDQSASQVRTPECVSARPQAETSIGRSPLAPFENIILKQLDSSNSKLTAENNAPSEANTRREILNQVSDFSQVSTVKAPKQKDSVEFNSVNENGKPKRKKLRQKDFEKKYETFFSDNNTSASSIYSKSSNQEVSFCSSNQPELEIEKESLLGQNSLVALINEKALKNEIGNLLDTNFGRKTNEARLEIERNALAANERAVQLKNRNENSNSSAKKDVSAQNQDEDDSNEFASTVLALKKEVTNALLQIREIKEASVNESANAENALCSEFFSTTQKVKQIDPQRKCLAVLCSNFQTNQPNVKQNIEVISKAQRSENSSAKLDEKYFELLELLQSNNSTPSC